MRSLYEWGLARVVPPDVAIFHRFRRPPYGGSNQFLLALRKELRRRGLRVGANAIASATRGCILNSRSFDLDALGRSRLNGVRVLHRVDGPIATYRGWDDGSDALIARINEAVADVTVFQSRYSLEAHERLGLALRNPVVIPNAVNEEIFHPPPASSPAPARKLRLISTSWSDNVNKGVETYQWLDRELDWSRYEYTFVGRSAVKFEHIAMLPPTGSKRLSELLRSHDVYVAASRNDPCSNALIEALACGLPAIYAASGGHPELVGEAGFGFEAAEQIPALLERLRDEHAERRALIEVPPLAAVADAYLAALGMTEPA